MDSNFHILSGSTFSADKHWFGTYHNINGTLNGRVFRQSERLLYGTTANLALTDSVARIIHFNENFPIAAGEDIEFCFHANTKGFAIKHVPSMTVFHNYGYSNDFVDNLKRFRGLFKKYGQGEKILLREIPQYYTYFMRTVEIPSRIDHVYQ
jgi:GT2 family glycosyltransferase